jgi:hypothetical protein
MTASAAAAKGEELVLLRGASVPWGVPRSALTLTDTHRNRGRYGCTLGSQPASTRMRAPDAEISTVAQRLPSSGMPRSAALQLYERRRLVRFRCDQ